MSSDEPMRRDVLQALATLPLLVLATRSEEAAAQGGGSPVKVDTQGLVRKSSSRRRSGASSLKSMENTSFA
jgi:hypothetical protein